MVVVADKILRIIAPSGRPATNAELSKLTLREKSLESQLREVKSATGMDDATRQQEIRKLEDAIKEIQKKMEPLKAQLEELKAQEEKEARASEAARAARNNAGNPYAPILKTDLTSLGE